MDKGRYMGIKGVVVAIKKLREPPVGPEGVRSTERSEARKVATRSEA